MDNDSIDEIEPTLTDSLCDGEFVIKKLFGRLLCESSASGAIITFKTIKSISDEGSLPKKVL